VNKILLVMQHWAGDKEAAIRVAKLVADLEPKHSELADFLFAARFDDSIDPGALAYVSRKFNSFSFINKNRRAQGWPFSCNELWFGAVDHVYTQMLAKKMPQYKAVLTFEGDSFPLTQDWLVRLHSEWDRLHAKGANMIGAMIPPGPPETGGVHINGGSCVISGAPEYLHWLARKLGGCRPNAGWDWFLAPQFKREGWADCPGMRSYWRAPMMLPAFYERITKEGVFYAHGIKDESVIQFVRKRFL
jgi:hypothetical protein